VTKGGKENRKRLGTEVERKDASSEEGLKKNRNLSDSRRAGIRIRGPGVAEPGGLILTLTFLEAGSDRGQENVLSAGGKSEERTSLRKEGKEVVVARRGVLHYLGERTEDSRLVGEVRS